MVKVCIRAKWSIRLELIPVSVALIDEGYFYFPLDGMLVYRRVTLSIKLVDTHLYTWAERGTVRVSCPRIQRHVPGQVEPGQLDPETSALNIRLPCLPKGLG